MAQKSNTNKVYINPNFNKQYNNQTQPNVSMYINPNFNRQISPQSLYHIHNPKIYVNPNFIKQPVPSMIPIINNEIVMIRQYETDELIIKTNNIVSKNQKVPLAPAPVSKSRYHLIRDNKTKVQSETSKTVANKIKINKYKIVAVTPGKLSSVSNKSTKPQASTSKSTFNYKKGIKNTNIVSPMRPMIKRSLSSYSIVTNKLNSTFIRSKKQARVPKNKLTPKSLKKNNIPCPQFKKYGKCLRKIQDHCEFLHDRKHVAICRSFLKGVCHNSNCLLSHDLTDKKMPTCYFYLNGMCTKEGCPYLHIKLNEKTKVCVEFLKGYCEKGEQCLKRHINICPELNQNGKCSKKICPFPHNRRKGINEYSKVKIKTRTDNVHKGQNKFKNEEEKSQLNTKEEKISDCRYYTAEPISETSENEIVLKPSRCKLGTLPSFIQL